MQNKSQTHERTHDQRWKRFFSALLAIAMLCTMMCGITIPISAATDISTFNTLLAAFKTEKYADGSTYKDNSSYGGYQCFGFANELAVYMFGSYPTSSMSATSVNSGWTRTYGGSAVDNLAVGDIVRYYYHSIFITAIEGETIYYCQANVPNGTNKVTYDNYISRSDLKAKVSSKLTHAEEAPQGWVAHFNNGVSATSPKVTQITASAKYAKVGDSVTFSFPASYATKYELVITNTTTGERIQYTMLDSSSFTQLFWSEGLHLVQVNAYGTEIVGFDDFYFEVHSGNRPNTYVGGKNEDWCFTPQELTILHDAPMQERIVEAVLNYYKDGTLWYTGSIIDTGLYTTYFYPGAYEGNILLTYESGYSVYTKTRCWYVGEKPSGAVITASSTMPKVGDMVTFTLNATGGTEHCIYIGDGNEEIFKSLTSSCTYQFTKAGTYYVYGWARNAYGENYPEAVTITVGEEPSGAVITASSTAPKVGDTVTFTLNATGGTEYCICIGNGDTEIFKDLTNSSTYQFTKAGTYYIYGWTRNAYGTTYPDTVTLIVEDNTVSVTGVSLNKTSATIDVGDTLNLTATVSPSDATDKTVTWTSSNPSVATVTNGTVTALKTGTATITATTVDGSKTATCVVTVSAPEEPINPNAAAIVVNDVTTRAGETFDVTVDVANNPGMCFLQVTLEYDESVLTLKGASNGSVLSTFENGVNLQWSADADTSKNGTLVTLTFEVNEDAEAGEYTVNTIFREAYDSDLNDVVFTVAAGTITVADFIYGDANGDGEVTGKDAVLLRKYMVNYNYDTGTSSVAVSPGADANGDGTVNGKDAVLLRRYMVNYNYDTGTSSVVLGPQQ